ncbi:hypothetical protein KIPB_009446, partial [Kipferlia bialata]
GSAGYCLLGDLLRIRQPSHAATAYSLALCLQPLSHHAMEALSEMEPVVDIEAVTAAGRKRGGYPQHAQHAQQSVTSVTGGEDKESPVIGDHILAHPFFSSGVSLSASPADATPANVSVTATPAGVTSNSGVTSMSGVTGSGVGGMSSFGLSRSALSTSGVGGERERERESEVGDASAAVPYSSTPAYYRESGRVAAPVATPAMHRPMPLSTPYSAVIRGLPTAIKAQTPMRRMAPDRGLHALTSHPLGTARVQRPLPNTASALASTQGERERERERQVTAGMDVTMSPFSQAVLSGVERQQASRVQGEREIERETVPVEAPWLESVMVARQQANRGDWNGCISRCQAVLARHQSPLAKSVLALGLYESGETAQ